MTEKDRELNALLDLHLLGRVWDEKKCRVCGREFKRWMCKKGYCAFANNMPIGSRADDPLDHLTDAQLRLDRERLPKDKRKAFGWQLSVIVCGGLYDVSRVELAWRSANATPRQQCEAMLRALGVEVEG